MRAQVDGELGLAGELVEVGVGGEDEEKNWIDEKCFHVY
jgi:hypothetical protein